MNREMEKVKLSSIRFREDLYPRGKHDPILVQRYADCLEQIESKQKFISVTQNRILVDGRHRHLAYLTAHQSNPDVEIPVYVYPVEEERAIFSLAVELNSTHGQQLSIEHKRQSVVRFYSQYGFSIEEAAKKVSVRKETALKWTKSIRQEEQRKQDETVFDMYLACHTQKEIAEGVDLDQTTVARKMEDLCEKFPGTKRIKLSKFEEDDWKPPLHNVWRYSQKTNAVHHFGNSEQTILENLLYLYTEPFDIVVDPFAGGGSTIDVCQQRLRRYWTSDRLPIPARENEIRKLDICQALPPLNNRWSDVTLTYLDPPYSRQAEGKYSNDPEDLANMSLEDFTNNVANVVKRIASKQSKGVIAMLVQPTQWKAENRQFTDHVFDIIKMVGNKKVRVEHRVSCPYSTESCEASMVEWAKENKELLVLTRELVIWRIC